MKGLKKYFLQFSFILMFVFLSGCDQDASTEKEDTSEIPEMFLEEDTMIEYETTFDPDDTSITEVYEDETGQEDVLDAEGETTVEIEIPEE